MRQRHKFTKLESGKKTGDGRTLYSGDRKRYKNVRQKTEHEETQWVIHLITNMGRMMDILLTGLWTI